VLGLDPKSSPESVEYHVELLSQDTNLKQMLKKAKPQSMADCTIRAHISTTTDEEPPAKKSRGGNDKATSSSKTVKASAEMLSIHSLRALQDNFYASFKTPKEPLDPQARRVYQCRPRFRNGSMPSPDPLVDNRPLVSPLDV